MFRLALLAIPVLCASVAAGTIKVNSGLADDLQAAIDGAAPGDVISVSGGPYEGTFTIPVGKDGLTIKGKATIDAQGGNSGFAVDSHGVVLRGLTVRQALQSGVEGPAGSELAVADEEALNRGLNSVFELYFNQLGPDRPGA